MVLKAQNFQFSTNVALAYNVRITSMYKIKDNKTKEMKQIDRWLIALYIVMLYATYEVNRLIEGNFFN
jgi:hypothetical protein